jgi:hypothetical protein
MTKYIACIYENITMKSLWQLVYTNKINVKNKSPPTYMILMVLVTGWYS